MGHLEANKLVGIANSSSFDVKQLPDLLEIGRSYEIPSYNENRLRLRLLDTAISVEDPNDDEERYMLAKIVNKSFVEFGIFTRDRLYIVHPDFYASRFFDAAISYFNVTGYSVLGIISHWASGTNFTQYNENLRKGLDKKNAAINTWTGQKARSHGFTKVDDVSGYFGFEKIRFKFYR